MDPFSAAAAVAQVAGGAWKLGDYIHTVIKGAKIVDRAISNLHREVRDLEKTCKLVHPQLEHILADPGSKSTGHSYDKDGKLRRCIYRQVADCEETLEELQRIVDALWPRDNKTGLIHQVPRQLSLQNHKEQIDDIRTRIRSHTDAMHTVLLVVNIKVSHNAPEQANQQFPKLLDELRSRLLSIESKLDQTRKRKDSFYDGEDTLVNVANETLRSGMTLYEASISGSVDGGGSVTGGYSAAARNGRTGTWVNATRAGHPEDVEPSTAMSEEARSDTCGNSPRMLFEPIETSILDPNDPGDDDSDIESEDEDVEMMRATLSEGTLAYDCKDWTEAANIFRAWLRLFNDLPLRHRESFNALETRHKIAVCLYRSGDVAEAKSAIRDLLRLEPESNEQRVQQCDAHHLLAELHLYENDLRLAQSACKATLTGRSRLLGKQHHTHHESLALMSRICQLMGDSALSKVYASRIPDARRDELMSAVAKLEPLPASSNIANTPPVNQAAINAILQLGSTQGDQDYSLPFQPDAERMHLSRQPTNIVAAGENVMFHSPTQDAPETLTTADHAPNALAHPRQGDPMPLSPMQRTNTALLTQTLARNDSIVVPNNDQVEPANLEYRNEPSSRFSWRWSRLPGSISGESTSAGQHELPCATSLPKGTAVTPESNAIGRGVYSYHPPQTMSAPSTNAHGSPASLPTRTESTTSRSSAAIPLHELQGRALSTTSTVDSAQSSTPTSGSRRELIIHWNIKPKQQLDKLICSDEEDSALSLLAPNRLGRDRQPTNSMALHLAIMLSSEHLVKVLIEYGFSPHRAMALSDKSGAYRYAPIELAFVRRSEPIIRLLLSNGAEPTNYSIPMKQMLTQEALRLWPPYGGDELIRCLELQMYYGAGKANTLAYTRASYVVETVLPQACLLSPDYRRPVVDFLIREFAGRESSVKQMLEAPGWVMMRKTIMKSGHKDIVSLVERYEEEAKGIVRNAEGSLSPPKRRVSSIIRSMGVSASGGRA